MRGPRGYKITFEEQQVYNEKEDEFDDILRKVDFEQLYHKSIIQSIIKD